MQEFQRFTVLTSTSIQRCFKAVLLRKILLIVSNTSHKLIFFLFQKSARQPNNKIICEWFVLRIAQPTNLVSKSAGLKDYHIISYGTVKYDMVLVNAVIK